MKKYKKQCKSTGGQILGTAGSAAMGVNPIVGGGLMAAGMVVDLFTKKKEEERLRKEEQLLADKNAMAAMGTGLAKGGEIKGKGTGTSDSIPAKLEKGDFIVPAKNAETALKIRQEHFGDVENKAALKDGDVPVNVSDGEVRFTKDEMDYLDEIGEGSKVRSLAPNATESIKPGGKYGSGTKNKVIPKPLTPEEEQLLIDKRNLDWTKKMTINSNRTSNKLLNPYMGGKELDWNNPVASKIQTTLAKTTSYTPPGKPSSKFGKFTTENAGAILGATQAIAGLIQGGKNARQERNLKPIQSNAAIANSEAIETKMTADKAANAIMAGNTAEADRATGNYMRMAKEAGGANSATVLANAARVGQSSSDAYLKCMTTAAQLKMAGQQVGSEMKIKAGEQDTQVDMYNDQATRRLLEAKSANANNLLGAGLSNTGRALARADYNKKMAELDKNVKHNLAGTKATTPTVTNTAPTTTVTTATNNTIPNVSVATGSAVSNVDVPSKDTTPSQSDIEQMSEMERLKRGLYPGYKKGGLVKKYKKSKILSYGR